MTLFIVSLLTLLLGCDQAAFQEGKPHMLKDSIQTAQLKKEGLREERNRKIEDVEREDSVRLDIAKKHAFNTALAALKKDTFTKQYDLYPDDSSYEISIEILIGQLFDDNQKYFLLHRTAPRGTYIDLFKVIGDQPEILIEREQTGMTYIRDTIFDVNGDGHKDFLVHWYPASGCCRRDVYNVYLNQPAKGNFSKDYTFINPTFSAKEKIIRGIEYGHPGEVGLYKFKWNGLQVDTIEFIYPDALVKGQFIKTKKGAFKPTKKEGIVLKAVPKEYQSIESYEWFLAF